MSDYGDNELLDYVSNKEVYNPESSENEFYVSENSNRADRRHLSDYTLCNTMSRQIKFSELYDHDFEYYPPYFNNITCVPSYSALRNPFKDPIHDTDDNLCYNLKNGKHCETKMKTTHFFKRRRNSCWEKHTETIAIGCNCDISININP
ncbi:PREDICTED: uncharacterized protein LOC108563554 isoform X2 [Nicrophorus vespilloides]|nr:PREDICTED: uncharacterized protein LOC108563554 isoform X2 [Nicrophorus vespilloides]